MHNAPYDALLSYVRFAGANISHSQRTTAITRDKSDTHTLQDATTQIPFFTTYTHFRILLDSRQLPWLRSLLNTAVLNVVDGLAMRSALRLLDGSPVAPVNATDFHHCLLEDVLRRGKRVYLLGGSRNAAAALPGLLQASSPGCVVRTHHGHIRPDDAMVIGDIRSFMPDVLFLGLGHPLQFEWIKENLIDACNGNMHIPLTVATGNFLEFLAGTQARAPRWMRRSGLEWLHRLMHEPARLWRRYLLGFPAFLILVLKEKVHRTFRAASHTQQS
ncbi:MAG: WecB/TagA/CpsF family glycosyltransferase [Bacteroidetes bacterium]|nr:WecB/TagA/CpsF family glycosyltransferase [Bacteroidota bacterium]